MDTIRIVPGPGYTGEGISRGLARGLLVFDGDQNITGEGMGIGSVALRGRDTTYFSRTCSDTTENGVLKRTFILDSRMMWSMGKKVSPLLTRGIEAGISAYMHLPRLQKMLMLPVHPVRSLLGIHPVFETVPTQGTVTFSYRITGLLVEVEVEARLEAGQPGTLCLLNELSAAAFTAKWDGNRPVPSLPGWERVLPARLPVSLADPVRGIRFFLDRPSVSSEVPFTIFRGREQGNDLCWAGFCIELAPMDGSGEFPVTRYRIGFAPGAWP